MLRDDETALRIVQLERRLDDLQDLMYYIGFVAAVTTITLALVIGGVI